MSINPFLEHTEELVTLHESIEAGKKASKDQIDRVINELQMKIGALQEMHRNICKSLDKKPLTFRETYPCTHVQLDESSAIELKLITENFSFNSVEFFVESVCEICGDVLKKVKVENK